MAIIKCKMCGGDIEISADKTFGTCEYCGSTMTLPKTDDDQRLSLFNRGTHLRRNGEFDKAAAIYERLIGEGIIVRDRSRVAGCEGCLRITIGTPAQNDRLIETLKNETA